MANHALKFKTELCAGQMLGRYELLLPIGHGGMGDVWAARLRGARGFTKLVAVKTILNMGDAKLAQMLLDEATLASQIHHPNVAETIELGEHEGKLYSVMELIDGESLSLILRKAPAMGGVPLTVAVNLVGQVCRGLQAAHDLSDRHGNRIGLVHRDVSPPNVLVTYSGIVKIIDFGVATTLASRDSDAGEVRGKVSYFAPEQLRNQPLDARVDVFATGILLYLLTTERHPFRANSEEETVRAILSRAEATPPSAFVEEYPEALEAVLLKALSKDREQRFASAASFSDALEQALPAAFGPAGDRLSAEYLRVLLRDRMLERRRVLRAAEDFSESSSPCASVLSVPAVAQPLPVAKSKPSRTGSLLLLALSVIFFGAVLHRGKVWSSPGTSQAAEPSARKAPALLVLPPSPVPASAPPVAVLPLPLAAPAPSARRSEAAAPAPAPAAKSAPSLAPSVSAQAVASAAVASDDPAVLALPERTALAVGSGLDATAVRPVAVALPNVQHGLSAVAPVSVKATRVRQLGSRVGHDRLAIDPLASPYRVQVPPSLQQSQQPASASISICVGATGGVTSARVQKSAGPLLDTRLVNAVTRWRYRPLVEEGSATPFCYLLRYQFSAR